MSFGPKPQQAFSSSNVPVYHRTISSSQSSRVVPPYATNSGSFSAANNGGVSTSHFYTDGRGGFQPIVSGKQMRGASAGPHREMNHNAYQGDFDFESSRGDWSSSAVNQNTQPVAGMRRGSFSNANNNNANAINLNSAAFMTTNQAMQQQAVVPPWQQYRQTGPVKVKGPISGRPQSSFASMRPSQQQHQPSTQAYNIITGGSTPVSPNPVRGWNDMPPKRPPMVIDGDNGSRVYTNGSMDADSIPHQQMQQQHQPSGRGIMNGRVGSAAPRSHSVGRGSKSNRASLNGSNGFAPMQQYEPPTAAASNRFSLAQTQPLYPSQSSPYHNPTRSTNQLDSGRFVLTQSLDSTRFNSSLPNGMSLSSTQPLSLNATLPLSQTQQLSANGRPDTAASDDGHSFLEVGVAEDPNPRFRPTMEDAHVVKIGDNWAEDETAQATARPAMKSTRGRFGASLSMDLTSTRKAANGHPPQGPTKAKGGYFAIYDGHGGREAVDYIERNLHRQLAKQLKAGAPPQAALESAFLDTDAAMQSTRSYQDCGSTVASVLLRPSTSRPGHRELYSANVGDARAVVAVAAQSSNGLQAVRLSKDHTPNDPSEADRVRRAGGAVFRGRVDGQLAVSRAIGDHSLKRSGVSAQPHQNHVPLTKDHKFMIVACDGLWDVITDSEAVNLVSGMKDANKMADKLVKTAMARGTTDNVSCMVVRLQKQ